MIVGVNEKKIDLPGYWKVKCFYNLFGNSTPVKYNTTNDIIMVNKKKTSVENGYKKQNTT